MGWTIKENNKGASEIASLLNKYGNELIEKSNKINYFVGAEQSYDMISFKFSILYNSRFLMQGAFDLTLFSEIPIKLFNVDYYKSTNAFSINGKFRPYSIGNLTTEIENLISSNKIINTISNALFLSTERGYGNRNQII